MALGDATVKQSGTIAVLPATAGSIGFVSADTTNIALKGTGGFGASLGSTDLNEDGYADLLFGAPSTGQIVALWGGP